MELDTLGYGNKEFRLNAGLKSLSHLEIIFNAPKSATELEGEILHTPHYRSLMFKLQVIWGQ